MTMKRNQVKIWFLIILNFCLLIFSDTDEDEEIQQWKKSKPVGAKSTPTSQKGAGPVSKTKPKVQHDEDEDEDSDEEDDDDDESGKCLLFLENWSVRGFFKKLRGGYFVQVLKRPRGKVRDSNRIPVRTLEKY